MAYVYQADYWCDGCVKEIVASLRAEGHVDTGDSEEWPQELEGGELCDVVHNCASGDCGGQVWISTADPGPGALVSYGRHLELPLSEDGYKHLQKLLNSHGRNLPEFAKQWAEFYGFTWHENPWGGPLEWLEDVLKRLWPSGYHEELWTVVSGLVRRVDADGIQAEFQEYMKEDGYFKKQGWYSEEGGETGSGR